MTSHKYYKRGLVTAEQFDGSAEMAKKYGAELYSESGYGFDAVEGETDGDGYVLVTLEGELLISTGMWIATGVNGEHWPIADDIFKKTYAPLPVIPQAVGEIIRDDREAGRDLAFVLYEAVLMASRRSRTEGKNVYSWIAENQDTFALAWLLGEWEVEE